MIRRPLSCSVHVNVFDIEDNVKRKMKFFEAEGLFFLGPWLYHEKIMQILGHPQMDSDQVSQILAAAHLIVFTVFKYLLKFLFAHPYGYVLIQWRPPLLSHALPLRDVSQSVIRFNHAGKKYGIEKLIL